MISSDPLLQQLLIVNETIDLASENKLLLYKLLLYKLLSYMPWGRKVVSYRYNIRGCALIILFVGTYTFRILRLLMKFVDLR